MLHGWRQTACRCTTTSQLNPRAQASTWHARRRGRCTSEGINKGHTNGVVSHIAGQRGRVQGLRTTTLGLPVIVEGAPHDLVLSSVGWLYKSSRETGVTQDERHQNHTCLPEYCKKQSLGREQILGRKQ